MSSNDQTGAPVYHSDGNYQYNQPRDNRYPPSGPYPLAPQLHLAPSQQNIHTQSYPSYAYPSHPHGYQTPYHASEHIDTNNNNRYLQPVPFAAYHPPPAQVHEQVYNPTFGYRSAPYIPSPSSYSPHSHYSQSPYPPAASPVHPPPIASGPPTQIIPTPAASPLPPLVLPSVPHFTSAKPLPIPQLESATDLPVVYDQFALDSSTSTSTNMHSSRRASSSRSGVKAEEGLHTSTGRPSRASRTNVKYNQDDDSEEEVLPNHHAPIETRHGRKSRAPARYGEEAADESDFENSMLTSPAVAEDDHTQRRNTRGGRGMNLKLFVAKQGQSHRDTDDFVDGSPESKRGTRAFPPRSNQLLQAMDDYNAQADADGEEYVEVEPVQPVRQSRRSQTRLQKQTRDSDEEDYAPDAKEADESGSATETDRAHSDIIQDDDDDDFIENDDSNLGYGSRRSRSKPKASRRQAPARRSTRSRARAARSLSEDSDAMPKKRELRERTKAVDYRLPPPDITFELEQQAQEIINGRGGSNGFGSGPGRKKASHFAGTLPWLVKTPNKPSMAMGDDDSDSDIELAGMKGVPSMPGAQAGTSGGQAAIGGAGAMRTDVANFGRVNPKSNLADADPLGVDMNVTFENVGGLDNHINQLKEMVALPLLYPEIYQQFGVTPPRGVLFHGPPGTGKTLLARALAASCSHGNTKIAFFMRKGADVLSKWVGEAERQLRMLFEEARNAQPSIIFFDEIDGLAPVRSSKQDQIHASLVSTLLALMDGMDGRGQVIVIGATNRPDAVDPALRRPGRFDREFYFPLPNKEARKKIIAINTRKWSPGVSDEMLDQLAGLTKGYGGADLRSLCTEAALNAVQRRYPQIYSSTDRLLLDPSSIKVGAKDFMMSVKKIIPSSARSASSAASPLPPHLVPILEEPLDRLKMAVDKVLPKEKNKTALEEAQYEDEMGDDLDQHAMTHALDKMRTFRPRILVHGPAGMGQTYLGPAILHHLEGFHVQSLDLAALMGDSTNTIEAALVQRFVEAKRHQPSVLFVPSLLSWSLAMTDTARTAFRSLLDSVPASDSVLLLAMLDGSISELPKDVRRWFGIGKEGRIELSPPEAHARSEYFASLLDAFRKPPTAFPDGLPRRKRVLETLPVAPPLPPREPTQEEIEREEKDLLHTRNVLHWSFAGLWPDIPKKFDRYARAAQDGAKLAHQFWLAEIAKAEALQADIDARRAAEREAETLPNGAGQALEVVPDIVMSASAPAIMATETFITAPTAIADVPQSQGLTGQASVHDLFGPDSPIAPPPALPEPEPDTILAVHASEPIATEDLVDVEIPPQPTWTPHEMNFDIIQSKLNSHKYFTPQDFRADIEKIVENAQHSQDQMLITKAQELATVIENHIKEFDHATWGPKFERYKVKMEEKKAKKAEKKRLERERVAATNTNGEEGVIVDQEGGNESGLKRGREESSEDAPYGKRPKNGMDTDESMGDKQQEQAMERTIVPSVPSPRPAPPPNYPPFICPESDLQELLREIIDLTADLNVDLLEQLRAGTYDRLYRSRGEWDRRGVIRETREWVREFIREVEEMEESE